MRKALLASLCCISLVLVSGVAMAQVTADELLSAKSGHEAPVATEQTSLVPAVATTTEAALMEFTNAWYDADKRISESKEKKAQGEELTISEQKWLASRDLHNYVDTFVKRTNRRVTFFERAHNWNDKNEEVRQYNYETLPANTNSYAVDVLRSLAEDLNQVVKDAASDSVHDEAWRDALMANMTSTLEKHQASITNDELRSYANTVVWYAAKQTVKDMRLDQPSPEEDHRVDLWKAIQEK